MLKCIRCKTELFLKRGTPKSIIKYCKDCYHELNKLRSLARYYKNKVEKLAYQKEYYQLHREEKIEYVKQYNKNKKQLLVMEISK